MVLEIALVTRNITSITTTNLLSTIVRNIAWIWTDAKVSSSRNTKTVTRSAASGKLYQVETVWSRADMTRVQSAAGMNLFARSMLKKEIRAKAGIKVQALLSLTVSMVSYANHLEW